MNANVGIRSKADLVVTRNGVVIKELKDCGNMILDNFFVFWKECYYTDFAHYLNLGSSAAPTTVDMTSLVTPLPGGRLGATGSSNTFKDIDIAGVEYVEFTNKQIHGYPLGAVVGSVRELGMSFLSKGVYKGDLCTRIVLPEDFVLTAEDQLTVYYSFITRIKRKEEFTFTADLDGTPTDFTVTRWTRNNNLRYLSTLLYGKTSTNFFYLGLHSTPSQGNGSDATVYTSVTPRAVFDLNEKSLTVTIDGTTSQFVRPSGWGGFTPGWSNSAHEQYSGPYTFDFDPPFPKTNEQTMNFTFKITLSRL